MNLFILLAIDHYTKMTHCPLQYMEVYGVCTR